MTTTIWCSIICFAAGALLTWRFMGKVSHFADGEIILITQKIESVKAKDLNQYNVLMSEWKSFVGNKKADITRVSAELSNIFKSVASL